MSDPEFTQMLQSVGSTGAQSIADNEFDLMVAASSSSSSEDVQTQQQQAAAATARNMRRYFELHVVDVLRRESPICRAAATTVSLPPICVVSSLSHRTAALQHHQKWPASASQIA
jgi:hypothetical protein